MANVTESDFISSEELLKKLNITKEQLDNINDLEIELKFINPYNIII